MAPAHPSPPHRRVTRHRARGTLGCRPRAAHPLGAREPARGRHPAPHRCPGAGRGRGAVPAPPRTTQCHATGRAAGMTTAVVTPPVAAAGRSGFTWGLFVLIWLLPFHAVVVAGLFGGFGIPGPVVRLIAAWKEVLVALLVTALLVRVTLGRGDHSPLHWLDVAVSGLGLLALARRTSRARVSPFPSSSSSPPPPFGCVRGSALPLPGWVTAWCGWGSCSASRG